MPAWLTRKTGTANSGGPNDIQIAPADRGFDIAVMIAVAVATLPIFFTG